MTRFAGVNGFNAILRRSLRVSSAEAPGLHAITLQSDGAIRGIENVTEAEATVFVACQIQVLVTLIGERLTLRILSEEWPDLLRPNSD